jgi:hypothetical protein
MRDFRVQKAGTPLDIARRHAIITRSARGRHALLARRLRDVGAGFAGVAILPVRTSL